MLQFVESRSGGRNELPGLDFCSRSQHVKTRANSSKTMALSFFFRISIWLCRCWRSRKRSCSRGRRTWRSSRPKEEESGPCWASFGLGFWDLLGLDRVVFVSPVSTKQNFAKIRSKKKEFR